MLIKNEVSRLRLKLKTLGEHQVKLQIIDVFGVTDEHTGCRSF